MDHVIEIFIGLMALLQSFNLWLAMQTANQLSTLRDQLREHELDRRVHK